MWHSVRLLGPTRVDSKGIFEQEKEAEHDSLPWLAGWWRVPHQRDGADEMRGRTAWLQEAWLHYPTVRKTKTVTNMQHTRSWKGCRSKSKHEDDRKTSKKGRGCGSIQYGGLTLAIWSLRHAAQTQENDTRHISVFLRSLERRKKSFRAYFCAPQFAFHTSMPQ